MTQPSLLDAAESRTFTEAVAGYLKARAGVWIDGVTLEGIGGRYAWRSRVSDCRTQLGMVIENRQRRVKRPDGSSYVISEYRYVPADHQVAV